MKDIIYFFVFQNDLFMEASLLSSGTELNAFRKRLAFYVLRANISLSGSVVRDLSVIIMGFIVDCHLRQNYLVFLLFFLFLVIMWCFNFRGLFYIFVRVHSLLQCFCIILNHIN